jgi:hypothetical protein
MVLEPTINKDSILDLILPLAQEEWKNERAFLLSKIGSINNNFISSFAKSENLTVKKLIEKYLSDQCIVRSHSKMSVRVGVLPKKLETADDNTIDHWLRIDDAIQSQMKPRYFRSFWTAFRKLAVDGEQRYVSLVRPFEFKNFSDGELAPPHMKLIDSSLIAQSDALPDSEIEKNILKWCKMNGLKSDLFLFDVINHRQSDEVNKNDGKVTLLLSQIISRLSDDELKSVSLPLSVIKKLLG